jgi:hypothetical protein
MKCEDEGDDLPRAEPHRVSDLAERFSETIKPRRLADAIAPDGSSKQPWRVARQSPGLMECRRRGMLNGVFGTALYLRRVAEHSRESRLQDRQTSFSQFDRNVANRNSESVQCVDCEATECLAGAALP